MSDCDCPVKQLPVVIVTPQEELSVTVCQQDIPPVVVIEKEIVLAEATIMVPGLQGPKGDPGKDGKNGESATVSVGTVVSGSEASVENVGTANDAVLNFVLPKGDRGVQGKAGPQGIQGEKGDKGDKGDPGEIKAITQAQIDNLF